MLVSHSEIIKNKAGIVNNKDVYFFTLINALGNKVIISNYGGAITSWINADKNGNEIDCIVGFNDLESYLKPHPYFGTIIGRYANRIAKGKFELNGQIFSLAKNDGSNHIHGGNKGFDKVVWDAKIINDRTLQLTYCSKDGEEGYPGNLIVTVIYAFTSGNELVIKYAATTDKATPVNLTSHCYFNLTGSTANTIYNHQLCINSRQLTIMDNKKIPTGQLMPVKDSIYDFTVPGKIPAADFDHNFILNNTKKELILAATVVENKTGTRLKVFTTEPAIQFYTGNALDGSCINKDGIPINKHTAFCLETQHYPDSPNHPAFPDTILQPHKQYHSTTIYQLLLG